MRWVLLVLYEDMIYKIAYTHIRNCIYAYMKLGVAVAVHDAKVLVAHCTG